MDGQQGTYLVKKLARNLHNLNFKLVLDECHEVGFDYVTINDLVSLTSILDAHLCQLLCALKSECQYWTFIKSEFRCKLKAALTQAVVSHIPF